MQIDKMTKKELALFEVDKNLDLLVKKIELLNYINPTNIAKQKQLFFKSKYTLNPSFTYPKRNFNSFELQRALFALPIEDIEDEVLRELYKDIIYSYSGLIQCIDTIGRGEEFYYNSLRSFGTPVETDVENAKFILHFTANESKTIGDLPQYDVYKTEQQFRAYSKRYDFSYSIKHSDKLAAIAMVLSNDKTLVLNKNHTFTANEIKILTNHEIGVHMVTTMNAELHQLKIFNHGFPKNVETQEGLAVYSEYMANGLTLKRLRELAYRVIAVDSLEKGYDFVETFKLLHNTYNLGENKAFAITLRVHRGGGFTKDYLYLTGLKKIYDYHKDGKDLNLLLTGKVSIKYASQIAYMIDNKYANSAKYITDSYFINKNESDKIAFILKSLK
jgi:uncharacterized protein (TIGR02421 family)